MKTKICLDMYVLSLVMLAMVALGFGIRQLMIVHTPEHHSEIDIRLNHLGDLQVK